MTVPEAMRALPVIGTVFLLCMVAWMPMALHAQESDNNRSLEDLEKKITRLEAELEEKALGPPQPGANFPFPLGPSTRDGRENWYEWKRTGNINMIAVYGGLDIMDVRLGAHLPEGKNYNLDDGKGERRAARKMHLKRFTDALFMDSHAVPQQLLQ